MKYFLLRDNYVIYLFDVVTFFNDVRITLYFGTFELRMEITLELCFVFVRQLYYLLFDVVTVFDYVRITLFWYVRITYENYVIKWLFFGYVCL